MSVIYEDTPMHRRRASMWWENNTNETGDVDNFIQVNVLFLTAAIIHELNQASHLLV